MKKTLIFIILLLLLTGCKKETYYKKIYLQESFSIVPFIYVNAADKVDETKLNKILMDLDNKFSTYNENSVVSNINKNAGISKVNVDNEVIEVIKQALYISSLSIINFKAMYDITIYPVWKTWDFSNKYFDPYFENYQTIPNDETIASLIPLVDYHNIILDEINNTVYLKNKGMGIDLGSIVKGYATDLLKKELIRQKVKNGVINIGGNIITYGSNNNSPWDIKIKTPYDDNTDTYYIGMYKGYDATIVTSGVYERYIKTEDLKEYHHILDPNSGYPIDNDLLSVTIITDSSIVADSLSTAVYSIGLEKGMELVNSLNGIEAVFINKDKEIYTNTELNNFELNTNIEKIGYSFKGVYNGISN